MQVTSRTNENILLILDGCSAHCKIESDNIIITFLPPNVTSTSQPLDQGLISTLKRKYRLKMLEKMVQGKSVQDFIIARNQPRKKAGFKNGGLPDVMDTMKLLNEAWGSILPSTITKCWIRAKIVLLITLAAITNYNEEGESPNDDKVIANLCNTLSSVTLNQPSQNNTMNLKCKNKKNLEKNILNWVNIENNVYNLQDIIMEIDKDDTNDSRKEEEHELNILKNNSMNEMNLITYNSQSWTNQITYNLQGGTNEITYNLQSSTNEIGYNLQGGNNEIRYNLQGGTNEITYNLQDRTNEVGYNLQGGTNETLCNLQGGTNKIPNHSQSGTNNIGKNSQGSKQNNPSVYQELFCLTEEIVPKMMLIENELKKEIYELNDFFKTFENIQKYLQRKKNET